jgi:hypothetical protein
MVQRETRRANQNVVLSLYRSKVAVQPVENLANHFDPRRHMPGVLKDHETLVFGGRGKEIEQWLLRGFYRVNRVVPASQHENRQLDSRQELDRIDLRVPLTGGYLALQAETAPIHFRELELLDLEGGTDPAAANCKPSYVKSNPVKCRR